MKNKKGKAGIDEEEEERKKEEEEEEEEAKVKKESVVAADASGPLSWVDDSIANDDINFGFTSAKKGKKKKGKVGFLFLVTD